MGILEVLKQSAATGRSRESAQALNGIVVAQFAVSTALLAGAGTLVRGYINAQLAPVGFSTSGMLLATLDLAQLRLDPAAGSRTYESVIERVSALPGVADVGLGVRGRRCSVYRSGRCVDVERVPPDWHVSNQHRLDRGDP